ncbi:helix-turn-helix transcriptional regulator [Agrobacterium sp. rho-8.1]|nr:LuxR C-terminal-related transcriptional regulator [Agrobacterium sp. rho-8.1]
MLADVQQLFDFLCYYVLDTSRLLEKEPISFLFPSNIAASLFHKADECIAHYASIFIQSPGSLGPERWDLSEMETGNCITPEAAASFRAGCLVRGAMFPALGISGAPRLIGFAGDRPHLNLDETEKLNVLMIHAHARLTTITGNQAQERQPLSGLEKQVMSLALEGHGFETIAATMALTSRTINYLAKAICRKMEVESIEHAVAVTLRRRTIL